MTRKNTHRDDTNDDDIQVTVDSDGTHIRTTDDGIRVNIRGSARNLRSARRVIR